MFWNLNTNTQRNIAIIDADQSEQIRYKELFEKSSWLERKISAEKKQLIFLYADNSYQSIISYLAILRSGHACCLVDKNLDHELKVELVDKYKPELILSRNPEVHYNYHEFIFDDSFFIYSNKDDLTNKYVINKDLALLLSTSGSTGSPKLVRLSYKNIQANAESIAKYLNIGDKERPITSLPMAYSFGLSVINSHLLMGSTIVQTNKSFVLRDFWYDFQKYECTSFSGVPYSYALLEKINFSKLDLPTLKTMTQAGGRLNDDLQRQYHKLSMEKGLKFFVMYGQTEATARMSYVPYEVLKDKIGSIGIPIPGGKFKLFVDGKEIIEEGVEGEIVFEGDNVMMGYAEERNDLAKGDENKGILYTGDLGKFDSDRIFYVTGRLKRFIKIHGTRCNLDEIEKKIENTFKVPTICIGEDDSLFIKLKSSDVTLLAKIKNYVSRLYHIHQSTLHTDLISSFPLNKSGKPDYKSLITNHTNT